MKEQEEFNLALRQLNDKIRESLEIARDAKYKVSKLDAHSFGNLMAFVHTNRNILNLIK